MMAVGLAVWIGIPAATHAVVFDLPVQNQLGRPFEPWPDEAPTHLLTVTPSGGLVWNGQPINQAMLVENVTRIGTSAPRHGLVFEPEAHASYELVASVMAILVASGVTDRRFCLGGLRQYADDLNGSRDRRYLISIYSEQGRGIDRVDRETMVGCEETLS